MRIRTHLIFIFLALFLFSCQEEKKNEKDLFSIKVDTPTKKLKAQDEFEISLSGAEEIDSVQYFYADKQIKSAKNKEKISVSLTTPLGRKTLSAKIYRKGKEFKAEKNLVLHAAQKPKVYTYKIKNKYPHDPKAFTQGLEFYQDTLYEGTGQYGLSDLRKVDYKTGKVLHSKKLDRIYFGEGISILNDKVYQLTWQEGLGFVYDANSLERIDKFEYNQSPEGWGLCNDEEVLYKSDGTNKIWRIDPETYQEIDYIEPVTHKALATKVNELEWINGKIYANTWQKDGVLIINPETGAVEGIIDFRGLKDELKNSVKADVLNGIAYLKNEDRIFVTGKNWDTLFEVDVVEK